MEWFGIASKVSKDVAELRRSRTDVEAELAQVLEDEPALAEMLYVATVELSVSRN